jgi:hypothetical protein
MIKKGLRVSFVYRSEIEKKYRKLRKNIGNRGFLSLNSLLTSLFNSSDQTMGKAVSSLAVWAFPGGIGHSEDDDLTHSHDSFHSISAKNADGETVDFKEYEGKVVMVVNSARM